MTSNGWKCFLSILILVAASASAAPEVARKRVIISTDLGIGLTGGWRSGVDADDGWAVGMALGERSLNVRLIATVFGNSNVSPEEIVSERLVRELFKSDVPRARGAALKLDSPQAALLAKPLTRDCWNGAVEAMSNTLASGRATIIAIGPLTDIGCLAMNASPAVLANIDEVIAIMGRPPGQEFLIGSVSGLTDFNVTMDPQALDVLLTQSEIPLTFLQFRLTSKVLIPRAVVATFNGGNALQQFFYDGTIPWINGWQKTFSEDGFHPWDSNAVWYAVHPEAFVCEDVNFRIQPCAKDSTDTYNRLGGCAGHSGCQGSSLDKEAAQLWLDDGLTNSRRVRTCTGYRSAADRLAFEKAVTGFLSTR